MSTALVVKASTQLAATLGIEPAMMIETIKAMCFPTMRPENISDAQTAAFVSVCATQDLNPLVAGMVYAYPTKSGGIVPVIGPDGVFKKLGERKDVTYECEVYPDDVTLKPTHAKATIFVDGKERGYTFTAVFSEWCVSSNPNWTMRPRHMIWLRAIKQCARQVINGLPMDDDEVTIAGLKNVTGTGDGETQTQQEPIKRAEPPARSKRGVAAVQENAKAETTAIEVETVKEAEKPAEKTVEKVAEKPAEKAVATPKAEAKSDAPAAVVLEDGKEITLEGLVVERFVVKPINGVADSVQAEVKGSYSGNVYHLGGDCPAWQIEQLVTLRVVGKKLKDRVVDGKIVPGVIAAMVQSIELTTAAEDSGATLE